MRPSARSRKHPRVRHRPANAAGWFLLWGSHPLVKKCAAPGLNLLTFRELLPNPLPLLSTHHEAELLRCLVRRIIKDGRLAITEEPLSVQGYARQHPAKAAGQDAHAGPRAKSQSLDSRESKRVRDEPEEVPGPPGLERTFRRIGAGERQFPELEE